MMTNGSFLDVVSRPLSKVYRWLEASIAVGLGQCHSSKSKDGV